MIKRGIMEVADVVLVNKADGATEAAATRAAAEYSGCLKLMPHRYVRALPASAVTRHGCEMQQQQQQQLLGQL
jgi:LAO/AO transport system kinase